jgi:hypothetical protein
MEIPFKRNNAFARGKTSGNFNCWNAFERYWEKKRKIHLTLMGASFIIPSHSSVAQWQSNRLLTDGLEVRVPPEEPFR